MNNIMFSDDEFCLGQRRGVMIYMLLVHLSAVFDYLPKSMWEHYDAFDKNKINFTNLLEAEPKDNLYHKVLLCHILVFSFRWIGPPYLSHLSEQLLFFLQESHEEKQVPSSPSVSPSSSLINKKIENLESAVDIPERPSPVSVLELLFTEDDISPTKSISRSGRHLF